MKQNPGAAWLSAPSSRRGSGNRAPCILTEVSPHKAVERLRPGNLVKNASLVCKRVQGIPNSLF